MAAPSGASFGSAEDGGRWLMAWGGAAWTSFGGEADGVALTGDVASFRVGADAAWSRWLAGVAVSHSLRRGSYRASGRGHRFDAGMRLAAELGYGLNAFRRRGTMTPFLGTRNGAGGRDLRLGVGLVEPLIRVALAATRSASAPRAAGDFACTSVPMGRRPTAGWWRCGRADGPGSATRVRLMAVENGRSVLWAANPGRTDMEATRADETMIRSVVVFVGREV